ncbi:DUF975 family protein [Romboutsia sp.]|uniref:DUF975 family protein n=1 Tax=Romboutsia sp. TaxID=1965302 RepID=UPI003F3E141A
MNTKQYKKMALEQLKGKWTTVVLAFLLYNLVSNIFRISFDLESNIIIRYASSILYGIMTVGMSYYCLRITKGQNFQIKDIFAGFKQFLPAMILNILVGLGISLGYVLLIIPGVIFNLMISQVYFILAENEGMGAIQCIKESISIMKGNKMNYFVLMLSFIGWIVLAAFTFGIGYLVLYPYMNLTYANYYNSIKENSRHSIAT